MFIRDFFGTRFRTLNITVDVDPAFFPHLTCADKTSVTRTISINLYKLIYAIGTIQTRRSAPSNREKFTDKTDLIEWVTTGTDDFRVKIDDIRNGPGSEKLGSISEDFGVGVSVLVATHLFNIRLSTIQRIKAKNKRPDWMCQMVNNNTMVVECKGASSQETSNTQQAEAIIQKNSRTATIKAASLTVIKENQMTSNRFIDPPSEEDDMDPELRRQILRAGHYSSVFSFLGHSILSKYFTQMKKRLMNAISASEQDQKEETFRALRDRYTRVVFQEKTFTGTFYKIDDTNFLFLGVDITLISYAGFRAFEDYETDIDVELNTNHYMLFKDGILIIEIKNIDAFSENIDKTEIKNYQENNSISDIDEMGEISFLKYITYILSNLGFTIIPPGDSAIDSDQFDITGVYGGQTYIFELKLYKGKKIPREKYRQLLDLYERSNADQIVLITNAPINNNVMLENENIVLIGRKELTEIIKNPRILISFLGQ